MKIKWSSILLAHFCFVHWSIIIYYVLINQFFYHQQNFHALQAATLYDNGNNGTIIMTRYHEFKTLVSWEYQTLKYFKPINSEDVDGIISKFKKINDVEIYHNDTNCVIRVLRVWYYGYKTCLCSMIFNRLWLEFSIFIHY